MKRPITILVADDDKDDRDMILEAFQESRVSNELHFVEDGQKALEYLRQQPPYADPRLNPRPGLILLDLNMPLMDGRAALKQIKADPNLRQIPVVIMTTSKDEEDVFHSYDDGASSFISKPIQFAALVKIVQSLGQYWLEIVALPE